MKYKNRQLTRAIVVNATALDASGALSILRQFMDSIPQDGTRWIIFVSDRIKLITANKDIEIAYIGGVKSLVNRMKWDAFGLKHRLKEMGVEACACVSLQNTGFRAGQRSTPRFIYYHQSIPFFNFKWNPLKSEERTLWFYKHIYPVFVKLFLTRNTTVFVQLNFIAKGFVKRFCHPESLVKVYAPSATVPTNKVVHTALPDDSLSIFYPATGHFYKNHRTIFEAVKATQRKTKLYCTLPAGSVNQQNIDCMGVIAYEKVCAMYRVADALVFPSYIETYGLPLIEAALTGLPIIAADLPYAREVLEGYSGVRFVAYNQPEAWAQAIDKLEKGKRYEPIDISRRPSWKKLIEEIIQSAFTQ